MKPSSLKQYFAFSLGALTAASIAGIIWVSLKDGTVNVSHPLGQKERDDAAHSFGKIEKRKTEMGQRSLVSRNTSYVPIGFNEWRSPLFRDAFRAREKIRLAGLFQEFFFVTECDGPTRAKLLDLLVRQTTAVSDAQFDEHGRRSVEDTNQRLTTSLTSITSEMQALLGANKYALLTQFEHSIPYRNETTTLTQMLGQDQTLSSEQIEALDGATQIERQTAGLPADFSPDTQVETSPARVQQYLENTEEADVKIENSMMPTLTPIQSAALKEMHASLRKLKRIQWELHFDRTTTAVPQ